jgi:hypothetical protein
MIIAIDFDGTCVTHAYPKVGNDIGAAKVIKKIADNGHKIMLWTMRGNKPHHDGTDTLGDAVKWFADNDIPLWGINQNPDQQKSGWSNSHKQHAELYIDDAALGCPLVLDMKKSPRPFVNWEVVEDYLTRMGII